MAIIPKPTVPWWVPSWVPTWPFPLLQHYNVVGGSDPRPSWYPDYLPYPGSTFTPIEQSVYNTLIDFLNNVALQPILIGDLPSNLALTDLPISLPPYGHGSIVGPTDFFNVIQMVDTHAAFQNSLDIHGMATAAEQIAPPNLNFQYAHDLVVKQLPTMSLAEVQQNIEVNKLADALAAVIQKHRVVIPAQRVVVNGISSIIPAVTILVAFPLWTYKGALTAQAGIYNPSAGINLLAIDSGTNPQAKTIWNPANGYRMKGRVDFPVKGLGGALSGYIVGPPAGTSWYFGTVNGHPNYNNQPLLVRTPTTPAPGPPPTGSFTPAALPLPPSPKLFILSVGLSNTLFTPQSVP